MLSRGSKQKTIINSLLISIALGVILLFGILFSQASSFSATKGTINKTVVLGPIKLLDLHKVAAVNGAFKASIKLMPGLIVYFGLLVVIGLVTGVIRTRSTKS